MYDMQEGGVFITVKKGATWDKVMAKAYVLKLENFFLRFQYGLRSMVAYCLFEY